MVQSISNLGNPMLPAYGRYGGWVGLAGPSGLVNSIAQTVIAAGRFTMFSCGDRMGGARIEEKLPAVNHR